MNRDGSNYTLVDSVSQPFFANVNVDSPALILLTNKTNPQKLSVSFFDPSVNAHSARAGETTPERSENHFVVTNLVTLTKRYPYYSSKKGLTLDTNFKDLFEKCIEEVYDEYKESFKIVTKLLPTDSEKKNREKHKKFTEFCLQYKLTNRNGEKK